MWYLHQFKKNENDNLSGWCEESKTRIKEISLNFSKQKNRENKNHEFNLCKQFRNIKNKLDRDPSNARNKDLYNKIYQEVRQNFVLKCNGETSSRYFCSLEKKQRAEKSMRSIQCVKDGPVMTGTKDMLEQTRQFYVDLCTDEGTEDNAQENMLSKITSKLSKTQTELCEVVVTHDEITEAVKET